MLEHGCASGHSYTEPVSREQQILRAAEKLFHERSFDGAGVDAIAREAGIVGSGVYRHFRSKDEILLALVEEAVDALLEHIGEPDDDPGQELESLLAAHAAVAAARPRLVDIWQRERHILQGDMADGFRSKQRRYVDRWVTCLAARHPGHSRDELVATVQAVHALLTSDATRRRKRAQPPGLQDLLVRLARASLDGLHQEDPRQ